MEHWKKAARSEGANNCVEVSSTLAVVRDSKNPTGPRLAGDVAALVAALKADAYRR